MIIHYVVGIFDDEEKQQKKKQVTDLSSIYLYFYNNVFDLSSFLGKTIYKNQCLPVSTAFRYTAVFCPIYCIWRAMENQFEIFTLKARCKDALINAIVRNHSCILEYPTCQKWQNSCWNCFLCTPIRLQCRKDLLW